MDLRILSAADRSKKRFFTSDFSKLNMSESYHRRGGGGTTPGVSEYIANLNTIPSPTDATGPGGFGGGVGEFGEAGSDFTLDDDLAIFTDVQFFDFDMGQFADLSQPLVIDYDPAQELRLRRQNAGTKGGAATSAVQSSGNFVNGNFLN